MSETTARIRWDKEPEGGIVMTGHAHLLDTALFEIYPPTAADDRWILTSHLPAGTTGTSPQTPTPARSRSWTRPRRG